MLYLHTHVKVLQEFPTLSPLPSPPLLDLKNRQGRQDDRDNEKNEREGRIITKGKEKKGKTRKVTKFSPQTGFPSFLCGLNRAAWRNSDWRGDKEAERMDGYQLL